MTQEQSLADLISVRGLEEGGGPRTPLRHFKGKFVEYVTEPVTNTQRIRVLLRFTDLDVIESTEPYQFPTGEIGITHSTRKNSAWGIFGESLIKLIKEDEDFKDCVGKVMELAYTPSHDYGFTDDAGKPIIRDAWEVLHVEGGADKVDPTERALQLIDGKTMPQFNQVVFSDPIVKADMKLCDAILSDTFVNSMLEAGKIEKDSNEAFHRK